MAEILSEQYSSVFSEPKDIDINTLFTDHHTAGAIKPILDRINFTDSQLAEAMSELTTNAAPGPDGFPAILLKSAVHHLPLPWLLFGENR